jgi:cellulose 1,4-beta-cellobiosidase
VSDEFCVAQKKAFNANDSLTEHGGFRQGRATFNKGHVLVLSLWDDHDVNMLGRDSVDATNSNKAGSDRGPWMDSLKCESVFPSLGYGRIRAASCEPPGD